VRGFSAIGYDVGKEDGGKSHGSASFVVGVDILTDYDRLQCLNGLFRGDIMELSEEQKDCLRSLTIEVGEELEAITGEKMALFIAFAGIGQNHLSSEFMTNVEKETLTRWLLHIVWTMEREGQE